MSEPLESSGNVSPVADASSFNNYLLFWSGQLISILGSSIVQFVIIWWITITTKSSLMLALASFLGLGSTILVGIFAGVIVDRYNRKLVIGIVDSGEALATVALIYLFWINEANISHVLVLLTLRGIFAGFHGPATQAIIPLLVPKDKLTKINSLEYLAIGSIYLVGPIIAALLLEYYGLDKMHLLLWIDAITFGIAVIPLILVKIPSVRDARVVEKPSFKEEFRVGFGFLKKNNALLSLLTMYAFMNFAYSPFWVLLPLIVSDPSYFNGTAGILAIAFIIGQIGSILISFILTRKTIFSKNTTGVFLGILLILIGNLILAFGAFMGEISLLYVGMFFSNSS